MSASGDDDFIGGGFDLRQGGIGIRASIDHTAWPVVVSVTAACKKLLRDSCSNAVDHRVALLVGEQLDLRCHSSAGTPRSLSARSFGPRPLADARTMVES